MIASARSRLPCANRRVMLVILAPEQGADSVSRAMPVAATGETQDEGTG